MSTITSPTSSIVGLGSSSERRSLRVEVRACPYYFSAPLSAAKPSLPPTLAPTWVSVSFRVLIVMEPRNSIRLTSITKRDTYAAAAVLLARGLSTNKACGSVSQGYFIPKKLVVWVLVVRSPRGLTPWANAGDRDVGRPGKQYYMYNRFRWAVGSSTYTSQNLKPS